MSEKIDNVDIQDQDLNLEDYPETTWENNRSSYTVPITVIRKYVNLLHILNKILLWVLLLLIIVLVALTLKFVFFQDFEITYFIDGTDYICVLDPKTGAVSQYGK